MRHLAILAAVIAALVVPAAAQPSPQTTFRDSRSSTTGTATTDRQGTTTFRDSSGRTIGTATKGPTGTTTYRDAGGRTTGTSSK